MHSKSMLPPCWFALFVISLFTSCGQNQSFDCLKSSGDLVVQEINLEDFTVLEVSENINIYLTHDQEQSVMIKTGENVLPKIRFEVKDNTLYISDENSCNWVRSYDQIKVFVNSSEIHEIRQRGYGKIESIGTYFADSLSIDAEGTGDIRLKVNTQKLAVVSKELCNVTCEGQTESLMVNIQQADGQFDGRALEAEQINIVHGGTNIVKVFPVKELNGAIYRNGDIHYFNKPPVISVDIHQNGKLVNKSKG